VRSWTRATAHSVLTAKNARERRSYLWRQWQVRQPNAALLQVVIEFAHGNCRSMSRPWCDLSRRGDAASGVRFGGAFNLAVVARRPRPCTHAQPAPALPAPALPALVRALLKAVCSGTTPGSRSPKGFHLCQIGKSGRCMSFNDPSFSSPFENGLDYRDRRDD
jgi:hypothetical protein